VKQVLTIFAICALSILLFAQDLHEDVYNTQENSLQQTRNAGEKTNLISLAENAELLELNAQRVRNHRHIVVSAVMMMLFAGLCMTSVSTLNPE